MKPDEESKEIKYIPPSACLLLWHVLNIPVLCCNPISLNAVYTCKYHVQKWKDSMNGYSIICPPPHQSTSPALTFHWQKQRNVTQNHLKHWGDQVLASTAFKLTMYSSIISVSTSSTLKRFRFHFKVAQQHAFSLRSSHPPELGSFLSACVYELSENVCRYAQHQNYDKTSPI